MRELHQLADEQSANRLRSFLVARGISSQIEPEGDVWTIWVHRDEQRDAARAALSEYLANPGSREVQEAISQGAAQVAKQAAAAADSTRANRRAERAWRERFEFVWYRSYPITALLVLMSLITVVLCTDLPRAFQEEGLFATFCNNDRSPVLDAFRMQPKFGFGVVLAGPSEQGDGSRVLILQKDPRDPDLVGLLRSGQWWRLVTPIFLHFGVLHLFFNLSYLWNLGRQVEYLRGSLRYGVLVLMLAIGSNLAQLYWAGPGFGGISGVLFGVVGYVWMKGRTAPQHGLALSHDQFVRSLFFLVICSMGLMGPIANAAHVAGFVMGMALGARGAWLRRLRRRLAGK